MTVTTWRTDPAHTDIQFSAKHMMVTTVRGKFADVDGSLTLDEADPAASSGSFTVRAASAHHRQRAARRPPPLGRLLRRRYATPRSRSSRPRSTPQARQRLRGHGRPHDPRHDPAGHVRRRVPRPVPGLPGPPRRLPRDDELNREDWGLTWNVTLETGGWLVGKEIKLEIDLALDEVVDFDGETATPQRATIEAQPATA